MDKKDRLIKTLAKNGKVNIIGVDTTNLVEEARRLHDLSPLATAVLGRTLTMASIMGANLKSEEDTITIQIRGNGPIGTIVATAKKNAKVKGYVQNPLVELSLNEQGKLNVGEAVGKEGFLQVIKDLGLKEPYIGLVPLVSGEIAEDFTKYFADSEQNPCAVALGVLVDKNGVKAAGGYYVTVMPDITEEEIEELEENLKQIEPISKMLDQKLELEQVAQKIAKEDNLMILETNEPPRYECDCNKARFERGLISLGKKELKEIIEERKTVETVCQFCNKKYEFTKEELETLI